MYMRPTIEGASIGHLIVGLLITPDHLGWRCPVFHKFEQSHSNTYGFLWRVNLNIRLLSSVERWSVIHTIKNQSVAEHKAFVGLLAIDLLDTVPIDISIGQVLRGCLTHDVRETITADIPSPVNSFIKDSCPRWREALKAATRATKLPEFNPSQLVRNIVRYVDLIESIQFLMKEELLGNQLVGDCLIALRTLAAAARREIEPLESDIAEKLVEWEFKQIGESSFTTIIGLSPIPILCDHLTTKHPIQH